MVRAHRFAALTACLTVAMCPLARAGSQDVASTQAREVMQRLVGPWSGNGQWRLVPAATGSGSTASQTQDCQRQADARWVANAPALIIETTQAPPPGSGASPAPGDGSASAQIQSQWVVAYDAPSDQLLATRVTQGLPGQPGQVNSQTWRGRIEELDGRAQIRWVLVSLQAASTPASAAVGQPSGDMVWTLTDDDRWLIKAHVIDPAGQRLVESAGLTSTAKG